ncbi:hypothetical protein CDAR_536591 [Caerostris darwini]|uniref:Uncharacterized protein n=1 Tax=Caerostris darwini TaxID=1538125 RepID=A0AAV4V0N0_9ARAC|nr:hypothetical protein CDAR_536591 [Caerostris darwini]
MQGIIRGFRYPASSVSFYTSYPEISLNLFGSRRSNGHCHLSQNYPIYLPGSILIETQSPRTAELPRKEEDNTSYQEFPRKVEGDNYQVNDNVQGIIRGFRYPASSVSFYTSYPEISLNLFGCRRNNGHRHLPQEKFQKS